MLIKIILENIGKWPCKKIYHPPKFLHNPFYLPYINITIIGRNEIVNLIYIFPTRNEGTIKNETRRDLGTLN
jgi:hypothetical protein